MTITKEIIIAKIEIVGEHKHVQVAVDTIIKEDGTELSRSRHRHVVQPDMDISSEDAEVQAVANAVWTDAIKASWKDFQDSQKLGE